jgi:glutathione S-transferase
MLKVYGFSKVNAVARGNTRDLRVLSGLEEMQLPFTLAPMRRGQQYLEQAAK